MTSRVTVVVPIYNRGHELRKLVAALEAQTLSLDQWELVICDDGSEEDLRGVVRDSCLAICWRRQNRQGPAAARNNGLTTAATPIVAFTDSDCIPDPAWLESLIEPIEAGRADVTGGFVGFKSAEQWIGRCLNFVMTTTIGAAGARDPRASLGMQFYPRTGNMAVLAKLAVDVGGFPNERYGEDVEFGRRLTADGARVEFVPSAVVVHNEKRTVRQVAAEARRKGAARIRLTERYGLKELIHAGPAGLLAYLILLTLLSVSWPGLAFILAAPLGIYAAALTILGIQGVAALRNPLALVTVPAIAAVLHLGYGLGYWQAALGSLIRRGFRSRPMPVPRLARTTGLTFFDPGETESIAAPHQLPQGSEILP